ncbi:MAG: hypothetical protein EOP06_26540 [Proteobacteria bacterium]|nr:MAG: hypothetical protein EOP06_26540 [Pseudomonadota bacterium]
MKSLLALSLLTVLFVTPAFAEESKPAIRLQITGFVCMEYEGELVNMATITHADSNLEVSRAELAQGQPIWKKIQAKDGTIQVSLQPYGQILGNFIATAQYSPTDVSQGIAAIKFSFDPKQPSFSLSYGCSRREQIGEHTLSIVVRP